MTGKWPVRLGGAGGAEDVTFGNSAFQNGEQYGCPIERSACSTQSITERASGSRLPAETHHLSSSKRNAPVQSLTSTLALLV